MAVFFSFAKNQPFYQAQLAPMTTISILGSELKKPKSAILPSVTCTYDDHFHFGTPIARVDGEAAYLSRAVHRRSLKWGLVYEEWMDKDG